MQSPRWTNRMEPLGLGRGFLFVITFAETEEPITAEILVVQTGVRLTKIDLRGGSAARIDS